MSRNEFKKDENIMQLCQSIKELGDKDKIYEFFTEIMTETELDTLSKRWCILTMLHEGATQREIASQIGVSLCKVTRGAAIMKKENAIVNKILTKEKQDEHKKTFSGWKRLFR